MENGEWGLSETAPVESQAGWSCSVYLRVKPLLDPSKAITTVPGCVEPGKEKPLLPILHPCPSAG